MTPIATNGLHEAPSLSILAHKLFTHYAIITQTTFCKLLNMYEITIPQNIICNNQNHTIEYHNPWLKQEMLGAVTNLDKRTLTFKD